MTYVDCVFATISLVMTAGKDKWAMLAFLCAIFVLYTIDRAMLGLLAVPIQAETGLSNVRFGVLSAAIFWTYAICVPFSGLAGDRFNRVRIIGVAAVAWSLMALLAGFASGFWSLFLLVSVAIVAPQTLYGPSANALLAEKHTETQTIALSCHQSAYYIGWFTSGAAVSAVLGWCGSWRGPFFTFGAVGLLIGVVFLLWNRKGSGKSSAKRVQQDTGKIGFKASLRAFFCCKTAVLVATCYVGEVFVAYGYSSWGPKFIAEKFALTSAEAGTGVMFWHYASSFVAILLAGLVTDRVVKQMPRFRMALSATALIVSIPALVLFGLSDSLPVVWASAAALGAMIGVIGANQFTAVFDVVPSQFRAGSIGFLNVVAALVGSTAPIALGWLSGKYGIRGFGVGFAAMAIVQVIAIVGLLLAIAFTFKYDFINMETGEGK